MEEKKLDFLLIRFNISKLLTVDFDIFFFKDGKPLTEYDFKKDDYRAPATVDRDTARMILEQQEKDKSQIYSQSGRTIDFVTYIEKREVFSIVGNIYENKELVELLNGGK